jgi:hypothetical protein
MGARVLELEEQQSHFSKAHRTDLRHRIFPAPTDVQEQRDTPFLAKP